MDTQTTNAYDSYGTKNIEEKSLKNSIRRVESNLEEIKARITGTPIAVKPGLTESMPRPDSLIDKAIQDLDYLNKLSQDILKLLNNL